MPSTNESGFFSRYKTCSICGKRLPESYTDDCCPSCQEFKLLREVKDFIRENDVNEYQVADYFDIPLRMVKNWIREGRIEYRKKEDSASFSIHCQRCGAPVSFGSICPKCLKLLNNNGKGYGMNTKNSSDERMRFLDNDN